MNFVFDEELEKRVAVFLRERNLDRVNAYSKEVKEKRSFYSLVLKRIFDVTISIMALVITLPIELIIGLLIFIFHGYPILFKQPRIGKNGKIFTMYKFKSIKNEFDKNGKRIPMKERLSPIGLFLRKTSLDELPNFINILRGDMSIIGPRPLLVSFGERYSNRHMKRHLVKPGLESPRLIKREDDMTDYQYQLESDVWYVENCSLVTDIRMMYKLAEMFFEKKQRKKNAELVSYFVGYDDNGIAINLTEAIERYPQFGK